MALPKVKRVVMIMWDAFGSDLFAQHKSLPNLSKFVDKAIYYPTCKSVYPSVTNVSWACMMTGAFPERTHNLAYYWDREHNVVRGLHREYTLESIAESLARGGRTSGSVGMFMLLNHGLHWEHEGGVNRLYLQPEHDFALRVDETIKLYKGGYGYKPDFITVYTAVLDALGHKVGPNHPSVGELIRSLDQELGRLLAAIEADPDGNETAIILTADHGCTGALYSLRNEVNAAIGLCGSDCLWLEGKDAAPDWAEVVLVSCGRTACLYFVQKREGTNVRPFTEAEKFEVRNRLASIPGVSAVLGATELLQLRTDLRLGDLVLEAETPYAFWAATPEAMHGTHSSRMEMNVPLLMMIPGVAPAERFGARTVDIAPTIAALLGAPIPRDAQGVPLPLGPIHNEVNGEAVISA